MSKTQLILDLLGKSPNLTVDEIAEKLDLNRTSTGQILSSIKDRVVGVKIEGKNAKRYSLAGATPPPKAAGRKGKKPAGTKKKPAAPAPVETSAFRCGITASRSLIVVHPDLFGVREYNPEQTADLADLFLAHFEA